MNALAKHWLGRWIGPLRELRAVRHSRVSSSLDETIAGGRLDALMCADGIVAAEGWCADLQAFERGLRLRVGGELRAPTHVFRVPRPDIDAVASPPGGTFAGAIAEWVLDAHPASRAATLVVEGRDVRTLTVPRMVGVPYGHLHSHPDILRREHIYSSGAPNRVVSSEVLTLARRLRPPVLDFGCGGGALVRALRADGVEAYGLEVDTPLIRESLLEEAKPFVTLYDGRLPAPFADRQFASVACSEVLEHMPDPHAALAELARIASGTMLVTVPDMSAVPRGYRHAVVPWHLLESTHVNFFTQHSLAAALAPYATRMETFRLGRVACDRMQFFSTLAVLAKLGR